MTRTERTVALAIAVPGLAAVATVMTLFLMKFEAGRIPWAPHYGPREHFMAVAGAWARGLATGFFLCFFLVLGGVAVAAWQADRKRAPEAARPEPPAGRISGT